MQRATFIVATAALVVSAATLYVLVAVGLKTEETRDSVLQSPVGKILTAVFPGLKS